MLNPFWSKHTTLIHFRQNTSAAFSIAMAYSYRSWKFMMVSYFYLWPALKWWHWYSWQVSNIAQVDKTFSIVFARGHKYVGGSTSGARTHGPMIQSPSLYCTVLYRINEHFYCKIIIIIYALINIIMVFKTLCVLWAGEQHIYRLGPIWYQFIQINLLRECNKVLSAFWSVCGRFYFVLNFFYHHHHYYCCCCCCYHYYYYY